MKPKVTPRHLRFGWAPGLGRLKMKTHERQLEEFTATLSPFFLKNQQVTTQGKRYTPWDLVMPKIMDKEFFPTFYQEIGDCVGAGFAQGMWYLQPLEMALGEYSKFRFVHPAFAYGISRMIANFPFSGDGSTGTWMMQAAQKWGNLAMDLDGVPAYSGSLSRRWGRKPGPPENFLTLGAEHCIKTTVRITSVDMLRDFIIGRKGIATIASMRGFRMRLEFDSRTNKHWFTGRDKWPHQTVYIGFDDDPKRPGAARLNSWGPNAHGPQADGPPGLGWQDVDSIHDELRTSGSECYGFSMLDSFEEQGRDYSVIPLLR